MRRLFIDSVLVGLKVDSTPPVFHVCRNIKKSD